MRSRLPAGRARFVLLAGLALVAWLGHATSGRLLAGGVPQPLPFRHDLHAGSKRGIACAYCHRGVHQGDQAGVPSLPECMDCHAVVRGQAAGEHAGEVDRLVAAWGEGRSPHAIRWARIWNMPRHVRFSHAPHGRAGVGCEACHGKVEEMAVLPRTAPPTMGGCVECHRRPDKPAPTDCTTCHT